MNLQTLLIALFVILLGFLIWLHCKPRFRDEVQLVHYVMQILACALIAELNILFIRIIDEGGLSPNSQALWSLFLSRIGMVCLIQATVLASIVLTRRSSKAKPSVL